MSVWVLVVCATILIGSTKYHPADAKTVSSFQEKDLRCPITNIRKTSLQNEANLPNGDMSSNNTFPLVVMETYPRCRCQAMYLQRIVGRLFQKIKAKSVIVIFSEDRAWLVDAVISTLHVSGVKTMHVTLSDHAKSQTLVRLLGIDQWSPVKERYIITFVSNKLTTNLFNMIEQPGGIPAISYDIELMSRWLLLVDNITNLQVMTRTLKLPYNVAGFEVSSNLACWTWCQEVSNYKRAKCSCDRFLIHTILGSLSAINQNHNTCYYDNCTVDDLFPRVKYGFNNRHFRVGLMVWPPYVIQTIHSNDVSEYTGYNLDIVKELSRRLNFSCSFFLPEDNQWGVKVNGSWTGVVGMLERKQVDMVAGGLTNLASRDLVMDFTIPYKEAGRYIYVGRPLPDDESWLIFSTISYQVFLLLGGSSLVVAFLISRVERLFVQFHQDQDGITVFRNSLLCVYAILLKQGSQYRPVTQAGRTLLGFWFMFALVMANMYCAVLIASLSVPKEISIFNDVEEMVEQTTYEWGMEGGTSAYIRYSTSTSPTIMKLWNGVLAASDRDPRALSTDLNDHLEKMLTEKYAFIKVDLPNVEYYNIAQCSIIKRGGALETGWLNFGLQNHSPYKRLIDQQLLLLRQAGILKQMFVKYSDYVFVEDCAPTKRPSLRSVYQLRGSFYVCVIGVGVSIGVLLFEFIFKFCRRQPRLDHVDQHRCE